MSLRRKLFFSPIGGKKGLLLEMVYHMCQESSSHNPIFFIHRLQFDLKLDLHIFIYMTSSGNIKYY